MQLDLECSRCGKILEEELITSDSVHVKPHICAGSPEQHLAVIVKGNIHDGFYVYGPFTSGKDAQRELKKWRDLGCDEALTFEIFDPSEVEI